MMAAEREIGTCERCLGGIHRLRGGTWQHDSWEDRQIDGGHSAWPMPTACAETPDGQRVPGTHHETEWCPVCAEWATADDPDAKEGEE